MTDKIDYISSQHQSRAYQRLLQGRFGWGIVSHGPTYDAIEGAGIDGGIDQAPKKVAATMAIIRTGISTMERRVVAAGGVITRPQFDFPGGRRFHFREPGGNELAVWIARE